MKRSAEILEYLARPDSPHSILIAPNAPPVCRQPTGVDVALNIVLDSGDVYDTIKALFVQSGGREDASLGESGTFSLAVPSIGRFRVSYSSQRGSKVAVVDAVPFDLPDLSSLCADPREGESLAARLSGASGVLAIVGRDASANGRLAYALIRELNHNRRMVICTIERQLSYLVAHGDSVVIQSELGTDFDSFSDGLSHAYLFNPDLVLIGNVRPTDNLADVTHAVGAGIMTIISSVSMSGASLLQLCTQGIRPRASSDASWMTRVVDVGLAADGKLTLTETD